jgi:hypothetical protein
MFLKTIISMSLLSLCALTIAQGKEDAQQKHIKAAIIDHQKMAKAHSDAAQCLASGKDEKTCHKVLFDACPDAGIGKYCGMKHRH